MRYLFLLRSGREEKDLPMWGGSRWSFCPAALPFTGIYPMRPHLAFPRFIPLRIFAGLLSGGGWAGTVFTLLSNCNQGGAPAFSQWTRPGIWRRLPIRSPGSEGRRETPQGASVSLRRSVKRLHMGPGCPFFCFSVGRIFLQKCRIVPNFTARMQPETHLLSYGIRLRQRKIS